MKRLATFLALLCAFAAALAGQLCTIDPPRPGPSTGFYVVGAKLFDPTGEEFRIRGVNRVHYDSWGGAADAKLMGANTVRLAINFAKPEAGNLALAQSYVAAGIIPMPGSWLGTCKSDPAVLAGIVDTWVAQAATWTKLNQTGLINIANEFGVGNSPDWRDAYLAAIPRMRAAGYTGTLVIDSGACGQDAQDIVKYGQALIDADPLHNLLFDTHVYGSYHYPATASWMQDMTKAFAALKASGLPIIFGEFGPGRNIGPSPTMVPPEQIIAAAEGMGFGWAAWAEDDGNLPACKANDGWFSLTTTCGRYTGLQTDLTLFGQTIIPILQKTARPANL